MSQLNNMPTPTPPAIHERDGEYMMGWNDAVEAMRLKILGLETIINGQQIQINACLEAIKIK